MPVSSVGEPQARAKGNHDNPVSGNHPGTVTLNTQWNVENLPILTQREGRDRSKAFLSNCTRDTTRAKWLTSTGSCKFIETLQNPRGRPPNLRKRPLASIVLILTSPKLHLAPYKGEIKTIINLKIQLLSFDVGIMSTPLFTLV